MTDRDELRASKALQGLQFPTTKADMVEYARERSASEGTLRALEALPEGQYANREQAVESVPQRPEQS
ncbi:DUF2795 domain-containing protein [Allosaccharopolyspora coralli]|uniref:DUF2795 domain-containing protein n=1 Tax=Allosaccharopolyspora coralli TaxID=2665642 RepID=A0A5Q3QAB5_9PSEU|nr:DUF2795 domain-containing protein [Allosaccharopolyspora coralli]QGK68549.1 DUF2795 domain-containing protein [Allosaccharopolyspora coralli]